MTEKTIKDHLIAEILLSLEETFENVHGIYLDKGTSLFETLATVTAEEASRPVSANCATIAAQVEHVRYYIEVILQFMNGEKPQTDWAKIWQTVSAVTPQEWQDSQKRLRETYDQMRTFLSSTPTWDNEDDISDALSLLMHNAYHLGEIRQALCTVRTQSQ